MSEPRRVRCVVCADHGAAEHRRLRVERKRAWIANGCAVAYGAGPTYCKRHEALAAEDAAFWGPMTYPTTVPGGVAV